MREVALEFVQRVERLRGLGADGIEAVRGRHFLPLSVETPSDRQTDLADLCRCHPGRSILRWVKLNAPGPIRTGTPGLAATVLFPLSYGGIQRPRGGGQLSREALPQSAFAYVSNGIMAPPLGSLSIAPSFPWVAGKTYRPRPSRFPSPSTSQRRFREGVSRQGKRMSKPGYFRKRPVAVSAMQWDGSRGSIEECCRWVNDGQDEPLLSYTFTAADDVNDVLIWTLEGDHHVSPGDWIIKGVAGEFYPCKPDIFEQTYEAVA